MPGRANAKGVGGWLLLYLIASIPLMFLYAAGLSGLFSDYPRVVAFSCGWAIVWTQYFRQSARVRNTYG